MDFRGKFLTETLKEKFAFDIPPIVELMNRTKGTRWIISD
jgi:hypothetical protein